MYQSILVLVILFHCSYTQDAQCDFSQNVVPGYSYEIKSENYPYSYRQNSKCRWIANCPSGYNCRMDCSLTLPQSPSCNMGRFLVSREGDPSLTSADFYCGKGTVTAVSTGRRLTAGVIVPPNSPPGAFRCDLYAQVASTPTTCSCGYRKMNRIVGGQETSPNEYPMMAGIKDASMNEIKCGGTIISQYYVVTAAHCVANMTRNEIKVVVGVHNRYNSPTERTMDVSSIRIHPNFNSNTYNYDVAILGLYNPIEFNENVGPVCLPFNYMNYDFSGQKVTMLGWGTLFIGGPVPSALRKVDVDVVSQSSCQSSVPTVTPQQICTYTRGKDSCQNDSGGPLLYLEPKNSLLYFVGIISYGNLCASNIPATSTRITAVLNWIVQNAPANYCNK